MRPSLRYILDEVCRRHRMTADEIRFRCRKRRTVAARHEFIWLARTCTDKSFPVIAAYVGLNDHTTAVHGFHKTDARVRAGEVVIMPLRRVWFWPEFGSEPTHEPPVLAYTVPYRPERHSPYDITVTATLRPLSRKRFAGFRRWRPAPVIRPALPRNLTAILMGDPAPGRSALDMEPAE